MSQGTTTNWEQTYDRVPACMDRAIGSDRYVYLLCASLFSLIVFALDVLLICPTSHRSSMSNYIQSDVSSLFPSLRIDVQTFEESQDMAAGTCTLLRHFSSRIQSDFIILPCDFVPPPSLGLIQLLNKFRTESTYDGSIATVCFYESSRPDKSTATEEWGMLPSNVPIVFDERSGTLLYVDTPDDVDKNSEEFEFRMSLLTQ